MHLNDANRGIEGEIDFLPAYNARIRMMEGRHPEARDCLNRIIQSVDDSEDVDAKYIYNFSKCNLALYKKDESAQYFKARALQLNASQSVKIFLPFFSDAAISRILD